MMGGNKDSELPPAFPAADMIIHPQAFGEVTSTALPQSNKTLVGSLNKAAAAARKDDVDGGCERRSYIVPGPCRTQHHRLEFRSITSETTDTDRVLKCIETLRNLTSLEALLENGQFWFFQRKECFIRQKLLMKWDPDRLDTYILLPVHYGFVNNQDCFFVSHYWRTREHPDPNGQDMGLFLEDIGLGGMVLHLGGLDLLAAGPAELKSRGSTSKECYVSFPRLSGTAPLNGDFPLSNRVHGFSSRLENTYSAHTDYTVTDDLSPFISHVKEMTRRGSAPCRFQIQLRQHEQR